MSRNLEMRIPRTHIHISKLRDMWHCCFSTFFLYFYFSIAFRFTRSDSLPPDSRNSELFVAISQWCLNVDSQEFLSYAQQWAIISLKLIPIRKANIYWREIRHHQLTGKLAHFLCTISRMYSSTFKSLMSLGTCTGIKIFRHWAIDLILEMSIAVENRPLPPWTSLPRPKKVCGELPNCYPLATLLKEFIKTKKFFLLCFV
jgi:hypothetical protein